MLYLQLEIKIIMAKEFFENLFYSFNNKNILIVGDVMIDSYLYGDIERISPEAPVPVLSGIDRENRLGGAANVALNIQALGANPFLCSVIGNDKGSEDFISLLNKRNMSANGIICSKHRTTTIKTRVISRHQHILRIDEEVSHPITNENEKLLVERINLLIKKEDISAIIFEDYDKGVITKYVIDSVVKLANQNNIITLVDPKKRNYSLYRDVYFFKPNFKEFIEGAKLSIEKDNFKELEIQAEIFRKTQNIKVLMITLSEHGVYINNNGEEQKIIPAEIRSIADVSGAGDTVISVSALCLINNVEPKLLSRIANMAGGLVCEKSGVVPIDKEQLKQECINKISDLI